MRIRINRWVTVTMLATGLASTSQSEVIVKSNNTDNLNLTTSWIGGSVPGSGDIAKWDSNTAANTVSLGANMSLLGINIDSSHTTGEIKINSGNTLTLGAAGIVNTPNTLFSPSCAITLAATQTWSTAIAILQCFSDLNMDGYTLTLDGGAGAKTVQFKGSTSGGGKIIVKAGTFKLSYGAKMPTSPVTVSSGATITYDTASGVASAARTPSVTLNGGTLSIMGRSTVNTVDTNLNDLTIGPGSSTVSVSPTSAYSSMLYSGNFVCNPRGVVIFSGTGLGSNTLASLTPNSANIIFGATPDLVGANGVAGSTTNSILACAYGDTTTGGTGMGLVTYDATYGLRLLNRNTEYSPTLSDGQAQLDNVRLVNVSGSGTWTNTLASALTTINSLTLEVTGIGTNSGIVIEGTAGTTLRVASGTIYANQAVINPTPTDIQQFTIPTLDFNGHQGVIIRKNTGVSNGQASAPLSLRSVMTNDGDEGVVFGGPGITYLDGAEPSTYTGPTINNSGYLRITKSVSNIGIPRALVVYGGTVQNTGSQIPDTSDIYIHGGSYLQKGGASNSGSGAWETFRDLFMTGGGYQDGTDGTSSGKTYLTNAVLSGGTWTVTQGHTTEMGGNLLLAGGGLVIKRGNDTSRNTTMLVNGNVTITNTPTGAYVPLSLGGGSSPGVAGGRLILSGDLAFAGNSSNTNTATIDASVPGTGGGAGTFALNGTRSFDIGDGAADNDLTLVPVLINNGATVGGLTKTGSGTLALVATNGYTGETTVNAGTLAVNGGLVSPVTVNSGATLTGTGWITTNNATAVTVATGGIFDPGAPGSIGTLTVTGGVTFAASSQLRVNVGTAGADLLAVSGRVSASGGPVTVTVVGSGSGPWLILSATDITAAFTTSAPGLVVSKRNNTEVWLGKNQGTLISVL